MSANNSLEVDVLAAVAKGTDPAWRAAATAYLALFTQDPTETGSLPTNSSAVRPGWKPLGAPCFRTMSSPTALAEMRAT